MPNYNLRIKIPSRSNQPHIPSTDWNNRTCTSPVSVLDFPSPPPSPNSFKIDGNNRACADTHDSTLGIKRNLDYSILKTTQKSFSSIKSKDFAHSSRKKEIDMGMRM